MNVLLACEESQAVCIEFRKRGHEAYSCDILPCSGGHPEWHLQMDVFEAIKLKQWDIMIAFPPCTHLALSGGRWFKAKREDGRQREAIEFFMLLYNAPIKLKVLENPIGIISGGKYIKTYYPDLCEKYGLPMRYTQIVHPYYFGDNQAKTTCLWLSGLSPLYHNAEQNLFDTTVTHNSNVEYHEWIDKHTGKLRRYSKFLANAWLNNNDKSTVGNIRSKTFPGIAKAMAEQWG